MIKSVIDLCDYYVVIIGGRYGSVDANAQLSYTEMEFDYAVESRKPVMAFLHGDPGKLIGDKLELDAALRLKLDAFREKVEQRMVKYWNRPGDLKAQVALAIMQIRKSHPTEGWIRAGQALTPEIKAELSELRAKVRELSADLKDEQRQQTAADTSDLEQGDDRTSIKCVLEVHWREDVESGKARAGDRVRVYWDNDFTWDALFRHLGPEMMDEAAEEYLMERLNVLCLEASRDSLLAKPEEDSAGGEDAPTGSSARGGRSCR